MKKTQIFRPLWRARSGAALILALAMLVLLSGLVLAYMLTVRTEFNAAKAYASGTDARLLGDAALQRVIGQIREGTTQPNKPWISQPGLIRTFESDGKPAHSYKLYSADSLIESGSFDPVAATDLPPTADWKKQPSLWTDLNAPVADLTRKNPFDETQPMMVYPIFDGNHLKKAADLTKGTGGTSLQLSLDNDGFADIEGFKVTDKYADGGVSMPVKWLYVLQDGTLVPARASGTAGDIEVVVPADKQKTAQGDFNAVVGRVAYWTDDESAKVNINTASEGTYWDTPACMTRPGTAAGTWWNVANEYKNPFVSGQPAVGAVPTPAAAAVAPILAANPYDPNVFTPEDATFEWEYMYMMAGNKEYQRYTGHPATACLSTLFGRQLRKRKNPVSGLTLSRKEMCEEIYKMIPRVTGAQYNAATDPQYLASTANNSSQAGTTRAKAGEQIGTWVLVANPPKITPDNDRLYASVDEFLYNPNFATTATSTDQRKPWTLAEPDATGKRDKTREMLEMSKFLLTANSKAPEQNLHGLPRVSIWPVNLDPTKRTAFDKVFAFCSTLADKSNADNQFYFTRANNESGSQDLSPRNLALLDYLKAMTSKPVPGWNLNGAPASNFADKLGTDHTQLLTQIFDYIRCTNLCDVSEPVGSPKTYPASYTHSKWPLKTQGGVTPIVIPGMGRGMGRFCTISEMGFCATRLHDLTPADPGSGWVPEPYEKDAMGNVLTYKGNLQKPAGTPIRAYQGGAKDALIQFALIPELYGVMGGYAAQGMDMRITFKNIDFTIEVLDVTGAVLQTAKPFDGVKQPTMYTNGVPKKFTGYGTNFEYTFGGPCVSQLLLPKSWTANLTPLATEPNRQSAPPTALLVVKNAYSVLRFPPAKLGGGAPAKTLPVPPAGVAYKLRVKGSFSVEISSPIQLTPYNTTNEPIIQTIDFKFPQFTCALPEPNHDRWTISQANLFAPGNGVYPCFAIGPAGSSTCGPRFMPIGTGGLRPIWDVFYNGAFSAVPLKDKNGDPIMNSYYTNLYEPDYMGTFSWGPPGNQFQDVIWTLRPTGHNLQGDYRLIAARDKIDDTYFELGPANTLYPDYFGRRDFVNSHTFFNDVSRGRQKTEYTMPPTCRRGNLVKGQVTWQGIGTMADVPTGINGVTNSLGLPGDWDNGPAFLYDGALCNKADEGGSPANFSSAGAVGSPTDTVYANLTAYMGQLVDSGTGGLSEIQVIQAGGLFSPNRQIASPVMFGSLPTGVNRNLPWQTLLFRPAKYYLPGGDGLSDGGVRHPGSAKYGPPDHLWLDLFWMPVVEPYPISEPMATSGKVNLNQQIVPFTNISRNTALRSVLKPVKITALNPYQPPSKQPAWLPMMYDYKSVGLNNHGDGVICRRSIDLDNTIKQITDRLDKNQPFVSASEICDIPLIPKDVPQLSTPPANMPMSAMPQHVSAMFSPSTPLSQFDSKLATFWASHKLTGDNSLERPYTAIYPLLTTRSNSYTVHVRVQTLTQNRTKKSYILKKGECEPTGEFRGSYVLERYLDANTAGIYAATDTTCSTPITGPIIPGQHVLGPYRFRVVSSKQFQP